MLKTILSVISLALIITLPSFAADNKTISQKDFAAIYARSELQVNLAMEEFLKNVSKDIKEKGKIDKETKALGCKDSARERISIKCIDLAMRELSLRENWAEAQDKVAEKIEEMVTNMENALNALEVSAE